MRVGKSFVASRRDNANVRQRVGKHCQTDQPPTAAALTAARLDGEVRSLLAEPGRLAAMSQAARRLARPDAAERIATTLLELAL